MIVGAGHDSVGSGNRAADAAHHRLPCAGRHRSIAVEIDQTTRWRDVPEFFDIVFVMTKRDQIERALGSLFAHKFVKAAFSENLINRANPIRSFRMPWRRQMVEACPMSEEKCCHAISWRAKAPFEKGLILRGRRPLR